MTDFRQDKAIYLQMADRLCDEILAGKYSAGEKVPSVRELAVTLGVNANTVVKAYDILAAVDIIRTRRGLGYFVSDNAKEKILQIRRTIFMEETLPEFIRQMKLLGIPMETVTEKWDGNTL